MPQPSADGSNSQGPRITCFPVHRFSNPKQVKLRDWLKKPFPAPLPVAEPPDEDEAA